MKPVPFVVCIWEQEGILGEVNETVALSPYFFRDATGDPFLEFRTYFYIVLFNSWRTILEPYLVNSQPTHMFSTIKHKVWPGVRKAPLKIFNV